MLSVTVTVLEYYVSITIVQNYTGKHHEFVAIYIVTSSQQCNSVLCIVKF